MTVRFIKFENVMAHLQLLWFSTRDLSLFLIRKFERFRYVAANFAQPPNSDCFGSFLWVDRKKEHWKHMRFRTMTHISHMILHSMEQKIKLC